MGRKGRAKNWFWIHVKFATIIEVTLESNQFNINKFFYFKNLIFIISHFFEKKLKRNESQIEDSFQI